MIQKEEQTRKILVLTKRGEASGMERAGGSGKGSSRTKVCFTRTFSKGRPACVTWDQHEGGKGEGMGMGMGREARDLPCQCTHC